LEEALKQASGEGIGKEREEQQPEREDTEHIDEKSRHTAADD